MLRYLLLLLLFLFIARAFWRVVEGVLEGASGQPRGAARRPKGIQMARDPVCGTFVVPEKAVTLVEGRERLHFCSTTCRDQYRARTA